MTLEDKWAQNREVLMMRQVFRHMETGHDRLLQAVGISVFDTRLKRWRQEARSMFERSWSNRTGAPMDQSQAGVLYVHCLARVMVSHGIQVPDRFLPEIQ